MGKFDKIEELKAHSLSQHITSPLTDKLNKAGYLLTFWLKTRLTIRKLNYDYKVSILKSVVKAKEAEVFIFLCASRY